MRGTEKNNYLATDVDVISVSENTDCSTLLAVRIKVLPSGWDSLMSLTFICVIC